MKFPKLSHIISDEKFGKINCSVAIVKNKRIQAVNRHLGVYLDASEYIPTNQLQNAENKVFGKDLLEAIEKADAVEFREEDVLIKNGTAGSLDGLTTTSHKYFGVLLPDGEIEEYDEMLDDYSMKEGRFFEGLETLLKNVVKPNGQVDVKKWEARETKFKTLLLSLKALNTIAETIADFTDSHDNIKIDLNHADPTKEEANRTSQPLIIYSSKYELNEASSIIFMSPSLNKK